MYITTISMRLFRLFEDIQALHQKHGDYVRIDPSELSTTDPDAVTAIYGTKAPTSKGPWYTLVEPLTSLLSVRDRTEHTRRRKAWDSAFSPTALAGYETRVTKYLQQLLQVIERDRKSPINATKWFSYFVFDIVENLVYNNDSSMLSSGEESYTVWTHNFNRPAVAFFTRTVWLSPIIKRRPFISAEFWKFYSWIPGKIERRIQSCGPDKNIWNTPKTPCIFSFLLSDFQRGRQTELDRINLYHDGQLVSTAGSDSVVTTLVNVFFELTQYTELQRELLEALGDLSSLHHDDLKRRALLDAVIYETLRLRPPVLNGNQRVTPPEGLWIGDKFVPGDTIVQAPSYTIFRDPRKFERPEEFIPERWTTHPELVKNRSVFVPFSIGPYACVGRRLAMMIIRRAVAEIVCRYDVYMTPGWSREDFLSTKIILL